MADQKQHRDMNGVIEQEPLTGLNLISDATTNANSSMKSNALAEVDPISVSNFNVNSSVNTSFKSTTDLKKVSIAEANEEAGGINESHEVVLPEGEDIEDRLADDIDEANVQMEVGEKKKKSKKKKPKSQRGLVRFQSSVKEIPC